MNAEAALNISISQPCLSVISGSRLYGTERYDEQGNCVSDTDMRSVVVPPWEYWTTRQFDQRKGTGEDHCIWSLSFFIKQLLQMNPQFMECLFAPTHLILRLDSIGKELIEMRHLFVAKKFYKRLLGFSNSEYRKAKGMRIEFEKETKSESQSWDTLREIFGPKWGERRKEIADDVRELIYQCHGQTEIPSKTGITNKRLQEFDKFGFCVSSACHSLRLVRQCTELLLHGTMTFPRPDAAELRDLKTGKLSLNRYEELYLQSNQEVGEAIKKSTLPDLPDSKAVTAWYEKIVKSTLANDKRLHETIE